ncbi:UNVERIFIED_CONTAM: hypothetical protein Slati_2908900 [Sesamum latifolium]|uniref:Uncharacterized protein n=1 Tax=Sesamum latifolium TaxID=2727402 RepID=A0AAW2VDJ3_9LAMI
MNASIANRVRAKKGTLPTTVEVGTETSQPLSATPSIRDLPQEPPRNKAVQPTTRAPEPSPSLARDPSLSPASNPSPNPTPIEVVSEDTYSAARTQVYIPQSRSRLSSQASK